MQVKVSTEGEEVWIQDLAAKLIANISVWLSQGHTREEIEEAVKDALECMVLDVKDINVRESYASRVG